MKKRTSKTQIRTDYLAVTQTETNDMGVLPVCTLLQAIARHNDAVTTSFFGTSSVSSIYCRRYYVQFANHATSGDTLQITSTWQQNNGQLEVMLIIHKKIKGRITTICEGQFSFIHQPSIAA
jgi:hypothetical protein